MKLELRNSAVLSEPFTPPRTFSEAGDADTLWFPALKTKWNKAPLIPVLDTTTFSLHNWHVLFSHSSCGQLTPHYTDNNALKGRVWFLSNLSRKHLRGVFTWGKKSIAAFSTGLSWNGSREQNKPLGGAWGVELAQNCHQESTSLAHICWYLDFSAKK